MSVHQHLILAQELEALVDSFQMEQPRKAIKALDIESIPKESRRHFARIARRCHMYNEAIRILQDNIYGVGTKSQEDLFEYASSIRKIGLVRLSKELLERAGEGKEQSLYRAYADIHEWNYTSAREHLHTHIHNFQLTERESIVAQLNLASCNLFLGLFDEAAKVLGQLSQIDSKNYFQFYLNYKELLGQFHLLQGDFKKASLIFDEALKLSGEQQGNTSLFIKKWQLVTEAAIGEVDTDSIQSLKREIRKSLHWETLRDFDYHIARFQKNTAMLQQVYFSTPYEGYRERMKIQTGIDFSNMGNFSLTRGEPISSFDPLKIFSEKLPTGMLLHRMLLLFLSDGYRPWSIPRIFDYLFCNEIYNPVTSPKKIYALTAKLQAYIESANCGMRLESTVYGYRLRLKENAAIIIYPQMIFESRQTVLTQILKSAIGDAPFSVSDLESVVPLSKHKIYRLFNDIKNENVVEKIAGSAKYRLKAG